MSSLVAGESALYKCMQQLSHLHTMYVLCWLGETVHTPHFCFRDIRVNQYKGHIFLQYIFQRKYQLFLSMVFADIQQAGTLVPHRGRGHLSKSGNQCVKQRSGTGHAGLKVYPWKIPSTLCFANCIHVRNISRLAWLLFAFRSVMAIFISQTVQVKKDGPHKQGLKGRAKCIQHAASHRSSDFWLTFFLKKGSGIHYRNKLLIKFSLKIQVLNCNWVHM